MQSSLEHAPCAFTHKGECEKGTVLRTQRGIYVCDREGRKKGIYYTAAWDEFEKE